ncbi:MAG: DUF4169 family protein [Beijerinckiaceae bacterium]|jgi:hypothetical protein|nr:DUF4169 family protein [Beijerinckiaceae bacterium]
MSADIVNLRQARKRKARAEADSLAAANRALFGRSKPEREAQDSAREKAARHLDSHRREAPARSGDDG